MGLRLRAGADGQYTWYPEQALQIPHWGRLSAELAAYFRERRAI